MKYTKGTHQTGERYKIGFGGRDSYFVVEDIFTECPDCGKTVRIMRNGRTLQEHCIPNTFYRCDASGAHMELASDGAWVLVEKEDADFKEVEEEAISVVDSRGRNATRSPQAV